eukprot:2994982-Alexandrium_andersonii.AAC.1
MCGEEVACTGGVLAGLVEGGAAQIFEEFASLLRNPSWVVQILLSSGMDDGGTEVPATSYAELAVLLVVHGAAAYLRRVLKPCSRRPCEDECNWHRSVSWCACVCWHVGQAVAHWLGVWLAGQEWKHVRRLCYLLGQSA